MKDKLKARVNKHFGAGTWGQLAPEQTAHFIDLGAHATWMAMRMGTLTMPPKAELKHIEVPVMPVVVTDVPLTPTTREANVVRLKRVIIKALFGR